MFSGHLAHLRGVLDPLRKLNKIDLLDISVLRSVGRSLPCSSNERVISDVAESIKTWKSDIVIPESVHVKVIHELKLVMADIKINLLPKKSHISLTNSALYNTPRHKGGQIVEMRRALRSFKTKGYKLLKQLPKDLEEVTLCDCFYNKVTVQSSLTNKPKLQLVDCLYRDLKQEHSFAVTGKRLRIPDCGVLNPGHFLLLYATGESLEYGTFDPEPDVLVELGGVKLPFWKEGTMVRYVPSLVPVRLAASATAGCKTRVVTVNKLYAAVIGAYMHHMIEHCMNYSPIYKMGRSMLWYSLDLLNKDKKKYLYSQDLKSATDFIPISLIKTIWSGIGRQIRRNDEFHPFLVYLALIYFPREVSVPKYLGDDGKFLMLRGSLMGDPLSFMTLSLVGLILDKGIKKLSGHYDPAPSLVLGDDYVTKLRTRQLCIQATQLTESLGLCISKKHGFSVRALVFAESVAIIFKRKLRFVDSLKLRLLTNSPSTMMGEAKFSFIGKASELKKFISYTSSVPIKFLSRYLFWENIRLFYGNDIYKINLPFWLPNELGGLNFPMKLTSNSYTNKYIHYFNHFSSDLSDSEQFVESLYLCNLYHNNRKSISDDIDKAIEVFLKYFSNYELGSVLNGLNRGCFYSRSNLKQNYLEVSNEDQPLFGGVSSYELLLRTCDIYSIRYIIDYINRIISFGLNLQNDLKPSETTIFSWIKRARKFWHHRVVNRPTDETSLYIPLESIVKDFNERLDLFVYIPSGSFFKNDLFSLNISQFDPIENKAYCTTTNYVGVAGKEIRAGCPEGSMITYPCGPRTDLSIPFEISIWPIDD
jgi:hypothetical protein